MNEARAYFFLLLMIPLTSVAQVRLQPLPAPDPKLIRAGRVLDVRSAQYRLDQGILTEGEKIKEMGARNAREILDAGVTSARILGHSGIDGDVALRDAINSGWVVGPRLQAAGRKITTISRGNDITIVFAKAVRSSKLAVTKGRGPNPETLSLCQQVPSERG